MSNSALPLLLAFMALLALLTIVHASHPLSTRESGLSHVATAENKRKMNEEFERKFGHLREGCFPRPSGKGCRCTVKDADGRDQEKRFDKDEDCRVSRVRRERPSQNVRDPVREKAQQNYAAVLEELKNKFAGLKEGCYPRPKGCLCVIGKDATGREITERRREDRDCKCQKGDRSPGCPARGA